MSEMDQAVTSEELGPLMKTNPVVLRRTLGGLRDAGIVRSEKGHGGGWSLGRDLSSVTLSEVYDALGMTTVFGIGHRDTRPTCPIEQAVNRAVSGALGEAEAVLMKRLQSFTVADVLKKASSRKRAS
jgi:DNA-binding IscR family transcriptional regulator